MIRSIVSKSLVGVAVAGTLIMATSGVMASATPRAPQVGSNGNFVHQKMVLEGQLAQRTGELARLTTDVHGSSTLSSNDSSILLARLSIETANIATLTSTVSTATTFAVLKTARREMYRDNRVYAVMAPQVLEVIESDATTDQVATMESSKGQLQASVASLKGQVGYRNALIHYRAFVKQVNNASRLAARSDAAVIGQMPSDFPHDVPVFINTNHRLLGATIDLAHASYDETIIGLASGGYTGA